MSSEQPSNIVAFPERGKPAASGAVPEKGATGGAEVVELAGRRVSEEERVARLTAVLTAEELHRLPYRELQPRMDALTSELAKAGEEHAKAEAALSQVRGAISQFQALYGGVAESIPQEARARYDTLLEEEASAQSQCDTLTEKLSALALARENTYVRLISDPKWSEEAWNRRHSTGETQ